MPSTWPDGSASSTLHAIWPFLLDLATIYRPERGYGFGPAKTDDSGLAKRLEAPRGQARRPRTRVPPRGNGRHTQCRRNQVRNQRQRL